MDLGLLRYYKFYYILSKFVVVSFAVKAFSEDGVNCKAFAYLLVGKGMELLITLF